MNQRLADFQGTLSETDVKRHLEFTFTCPLGAAGLELALTFEPAEVEGVRNMLCLSVLSPNGFRGSRHRGGDEHRIFLGEDVATPGYVPGSLKAGSWWVIVHTHMVMPRQPLTYRLVVQLTDAPRTKPQSLPKPIPPERGPGWYKGDLHAHSVHSDASWTTKDLVASARRYDLDFVTLSDHNTVSGLSEMDALTTPELLTLGGIELTTFYGHALALGRRSWLDWVHKPMTELVKRCRFVQDEVRRIRWQINQVTACTFDQGSDVLIMVNRKVIARRSHFVRTHEDNLPRFQGRNEYFTQAG